MATARDYRQRRRSRRDRHGRGLRGTLYPATLPAAASRAERFDALVLDALEPIEARWRHARGQHAYVAGKKPVHK